MAKLIVYVPFPEENQSDLKRHAEELASVRLDPFAAVEVVYGGDEAAFRNCVEPGDTFVLHAHGSDRDAYAYDNTRAGVPVRASHVSSLMTMLGAQYARKCYFAMCYSAQRNHIGHIWNQEFGASQQVYAHYEVMEGGLMYGTRRSARSSIFDSNNQQLTRLQPPASASRSSRRR